MIREFIDAKTPEAGMDGLPEITRVVATGLAAITDSGRRAVLESALVELRSLELAWDYGLPGERFECWLVGVSGHECLWLVYCDRGFGPVDPWGVVIAKAENMGMDSQWYSALEHAAIAAGILKSPAV